MYFSIKEAEVSEPKAKPTPVQKGKRLEQPL